MKNFVQMAVRIIISIGVSLVVLALLLGLFTSEGGDQTRPQLLLILRHTSFLFVGFYFVFALVQAFFRAARYRLLITAAGETRTPGLFHTYLVTLTRNMLVDMLPARLGELSYIGMMNKGYDVSGKACVSSLGISFLFDFIALLFVIAGTLLYQLLTTSLQLWLVSVLIVLSVVVLIMVALVFVGIRVATNLARRILGRFGERKLIRRLLAFVESIADAIETTRAAGVLLKVLFLSLGVRAGKYIGLYFIFQAVVAPNFPELAGASFGGILCSLLSAEAGASLPIPTFMSFGTYEAGGTLALTLLGFPAEISKVAMLGIHIWSQFADYILGGAGLITFLFVTKRGGPLTPRPRITLKQLSLVAAAGAVLLGSLAFLGLQYRKTKKLGSLEPPERGAAVAPAPEQAPALQKAVQDLNGFVVWSSNRYGNHDILMLSLPDRKIRRLTTHPHVDYFPRISPNGKQLVFSRSRVPWVSQRNPVPWDVYLLDLASGAEKRLAEFGNTPTWSDDGKSVFYDRNGTQFVRYDLATAQETVLFESGKNGVPGNVILQTPSFSTAQDALAVTLRGGRRGTGVLYRDGRKVQIGGGCQLVWTSIPSTLCCVDDGGKQKNAIYRFELSTKKKTLWLDLPLPFSHEYFPKVSNDGRYLVLGASTGGSGQHEHDSGDYEIFLWQIGKSPEDALRLTWHTGNDCWPDIHLR